MKLDNPFGDAREKFTVGQRVSTTEKAIRNGVVKKQVFGVVTGIGQSSPFWTVIVKKDGNKIATGYHMDFWQPIEKGK